MPTDDADPMDQNLADLLAAVDQGLVNDSPGGSAEADLSPEQLKLFNEARETMVRLERQWPRSHPAQMNTLPSLHSGRIGKYQLKRELGRGGNGVVYLATDSQTGQQVALKLPRLEAMLDPRAIERFQQESRMVALLKHPGLQPVYEAGEIDTICYIATFYAGDITLESWLDELQGPVPVRTVAALVATLAKAADFLHNHQILHRDIKLSNILLGPIPPGSFADPDLAICGMPRLTDFGLARFFDVAASSALQHRTTGGGPSNVGVGRASCGGSARH
ncbi:MAG: serine/threonine-protein kinase [Gemmataceae bacterium]